MGITPAAVTQYLAGVRGDKWIKTLEGVSVIAKELDEISSDLLNDEVDEGAVIRRLCSICQLVRKKRLLCSSHCASLQVLSLAECKACQ